MFNVSGTSSPYKYLRNVHFRYIMFQGDGRTHDGIALNFYKCKQPTVDYCGFEQINGHAIKINITHGAIIEYNWFDECGNNTRRESVINFTMPVGSNDKCTVPMIIGNIFEPCE